MSFNNTATSSNIPNPEETEVSSIQLRQKVPFSILAFLLVVFHFVFLMTYLFAGLIDVTFVPRNSSLNTSIKTHLHAFTLWINNICLP